MLNVPVGADASTVKKAYLRLSLQYHPDKNPDPDATKFWTESITPAYKARHPPSLNPNPLPLKTLNT